MNKNDGLFADFVKKGTYFVVAHTELNLLRAHPQAWLWNPNVALGVRSLCWFTPTWLFLFWTLILWVFHSSLELSVRHVTVTQNGESRDFIFTQQQNMIYGQNVRFLFILPSVWNRVPWSDNEALFSQLYMRLEKCEDPSLGKEWVTMKGMPFLCHFQP